MRSKTAQTRRGSREHAQLPSYACVPHEDTQAACISCSWSGLDLLSLDGKQAMLCSIGINGTAPHVQIKRFLRTARFVYKAAALL